MFKKILFPTEFSGEATKVTDFAIYFALKHRAKLIFFHVLNDSNEGVTTDFSQFKNEVEVKLEDLDKKSEISDIKNVKELEWEIVTVSGASAAEEIVKYTEEELNGVDLILMPTHSKTGIKRFLIGSNAEKVVRHAQIPVLTINTNRLSK